MNKGIRAAMVLAVLVCLVSVLAPRPAAAHPMGNFSINRYSRITVGVNKIDLHYIVDMAEIPAFSELATIREDRSTNLTDAERQAYIGRKSTELRSNLHLSIGGKDVPLELVDAALSFPPGQFESPTLRLDLQFESKAALKESATLQYRDDNFPDRLGWKEVVAVSGDGARIVNSSVPATDLSRGLTDYSRESVENRPNATTAVITFEPGVAAAGATRDSATTQQGTGGLDFAAWVRDQEAVLTNLLNSRDMPLGFLLFGLGLAFAMGAAHALSPGHGKTIVAAYLVGTRGTPKHAVFLGLTVTLTHTIGVFLLGVVVLSLQQYVVPETLYPWLGFGSGVLIMLVGVSLFVQRFRFWRRSRAATVELAHTHDGHEHTHDDAHDHSHDHSHEHDHSHNHSHDHNTSEPHSHGPFSRPHTHLPANGQSVTLGSLLALGISGGIIPCPSALVVLLASIRLAR
ncbi:MAG: nickel/cobalt transporter (NicO) family protein, partial [Chloroflexia bacterium]|nr:nickel/cobalt transporter (NicO) family protein [Chloroflexia bacterium]